MPSDRSRRTDGLRDSYTGVIAQQGRVTLDRDFNAEHGYLAGRIEVEACDVIGPCGTPDDGFKISLPLTSPPDLPLWSPPEPLSPPVEGPLDFLISPGTMYVGGQRAVFPPHPAGHDITYSFYDQPDWIAPQIPGFSTGLSLLPTQELVYLALTEQEISAIEDPELLEVALGGPDTTQRLRLLRRVARLQVDASDCVTAWDAAIELWREQGLVLDPATMRLLPETRLQVSFADDGGTPNPCDPISQNGYLGAENQTIRVQISDSGSTGSPAGDAKLLWGYDNASFLYRATPVASNPSLLTIAPSPPDSFHIPQAGQVVEIMRTVAVLASEPDMTDPTGQSDIVRCVAEPTGVVRRLTQPYGPASPGDPTSYIVLDEALPPEYLADVTPLFLRVWQSEIAFDAAGGTVLLTDDVTGASTGVQVTISAPQGEPLTSGAFWLLAVRPSTPQAVYPERLLTAPQPPDGPRRWACPLAVIDWTNRQEPTVTDCRNSFDNLVELTRRGQGCCTISVSPNGKLDLQQAADRAAQTGAGTICVNAGSYTLSAPLRLGSQHAGLTLESCGGGAVLAVAAGSEGAFSDGLIVLADTQHITLRGLTIAPATAPPPAGSKLANSPIGVMIGLRVANSNDVVLEDCSFDFADTSDAKSLFIFGAGLFLQGDCSGLTVTDSTFQSNISPTFHRTSTPVATGGLATGIAAGAPAAGLTTTGLAVTAPSHEILATAITDRAINLDPTSFQTIATNPTAVGTAAGTSALVAIVGCLALPTLGQATITNANGVASNDCSLGNATLRNNSFVNLTLALYARAGTQTVRIEGNNSADCLGGFWLIVPDSQTPSDPKAASLFTEMLQAASSFTELPLQVAVGLSLPLPDGVVEGEPAVVGPSSIFVLGNQIEPVPVSGNGTASLLILANRALADGADASTSLIIANNRLRSRSGPQTATAFICTQAAERCAISGNLILSESAQGSDPGPSLWLVPDSISNGVQLLTIVGNVLQGRSDLNDLLRPGVTPSTWVTYNAMPS
jgi:hypothetical protein